MTKRINLYISLLIGVSFVFASCSDTNVVMDETTPITNQVWSSNDTVVFSFDIEDTVSFFDFYLNLRTTTSYAYSNCFVFAKLESPSMIATDTINIPLADGASGRWLGEVSGSMVENHVLFMKNVRFHETGKYSFRFVQGMRDDPLADISDVGLTIKQVTQ